MSKTQREKGTALGMRRDPTFIVLTVIMTLFLLLFVVYPVVSVLITSFESEGEISLANYSDFFRFSYYYRSMINTLLLGVITTVTILIVAFALSYTISKTNLPLKGLLRISALLPLISPPFIFSLALIIIAGRRGLIYRFLGISPSIYGWPGLIIAQVLTFLPLGFLMVNNVLQSLDPSLEDASSDLGASQAKTLFKVIIPLSIPGLFKAALLVFIMALADFGNPMLIGGGLPIMVNDTILELKNLTKRFGDVMAVNNLSISSINKGEFITFLGPSGCGKTTLLRMIGGFCYPASGEIFMHGEKINDIPPEKRKTSMVFQNYALFPHISVFENIAYDLKEGV